MTFEDKRNHNEIIRLTVANSFDWNKLAVLF